MGRLARGMLPQPRLHASSGQARVRVHGKEIWLGRYGSAEAQRRYDQVIHQLLSERLGLQSLAETPAASPTESEGQQQACTPEPPPKTMPPVDASAITVAEVCCEFFSYANRHYRDAQGNPTSTLGNIKAAIRALRRFDDVSAESFGPLMLETLMHQLVDEPIAHGPHGGQGRKRTRAGVNRIIKSVRFVFDWAASRELVPPAVPDALSKLRLLSRGRTTAPEGRRVQPVSDEVLNATLPHLPEMVRDMVLVQRFAACRPGEVCCMKRSEVDTTDDIWQWEPQLHKNSWRDQAREIAIGPKAQAILAKYLNGGPGDYCFVASQAEVKRNADRRKKRKSPMTPSHRERRRKAAAKKRDATPYTVDAYRRAITRACEAAGIQPWSPNQLRHAAAHEARAHGGLDGAQARLGHATAKTTEIYASLTRDKARQLAREIG